MDLLLKLIPALVLLPVSFSGWAIDDGEDVELVRQLRDAGKIVEVAPLLEDAKRRHAGRLLEIELEKEDGRYLYEIEFVDKGGLVWEFYYDATTGEFIEQRFED